jgi:hypothetical protein
MENDEELSRNQDKEIQTQSQSRKNRIIRFGILEYLIFSEQIESDKSFRFNLFRKDFFVSKSKRNIMLPI